MAYGEKPDGGPGGEDSGHEPRRKYDSSLAESLALAGQLGFSVACPMVTFIAGGVWLDRQLHTMPWLLFLGILLGLVVAGGLIWQLTTVQTRKQARKPGTRAPYKVEGGENGDRVGTNRADSRKRTRR